MFDESVYRVFQRGRTWAVQCVVLLSDNMAEPANVLTKDDMLIDCF